MPDLADLERRVIALEIAHRENTTAFEWIVGALGRMTGDMDTMRGEVAIVKMDVAAVKTDVAGLRRDLPAIVSEAMREVLKGA